jgi:hypothetical protein
MPANTYVLRRFHSKQRDLPNNQVIASADGAIDISKGSFPDTVVVTKGTAAALTLAAPTAGVPAKGGHDGMRITILSTTAAAHTVTNTTPGFNNGSTASDVGTFGAAIGNWMTVEAYNGIWYVVGSLNVTLA